MLKTNLFCALLLMLSVPCAAGTTSVTCLKAPDDRGPQAQWDIMWDDNQRDVISVDGNRIPREESDGHAKVKRVYTLTSFGTALISWDTTTIRTDGSEFSRDIYTVDRISGTFEHWVSFSPNKPNILSRGTCRKKSEGNKF
ncbi:MAG: hypothetical protein JSS38_14480 [Nitrospira sp.]|nr:hypothetical protein [Nitrospira sp.]